MPTVFIANILHVSLLVSWEAIKTQHREEERAHLETNLQEKNKQTKDPEHESNIQFRSDCCNAEEIQSLLSKCVCGCVCVGAGPAEPSTHQVIIRCHDANVLPLLPAFVDPVFGHDGGPHTHSNLWQGQTGHQLTQIFQQGNLLPASPHAATDSKLASLQYCHASYYGTELILWASCHCVPQSPKCLQTLYFSPTVQLATRWVTRELKSLRMLPPMWWTSSAILDCREKHQTFNFKPARHNGDEIVSRWRHLAKHNAIIGSSRSAPQVVF